MRRRLFNFAAVVSLLIFAAACSFWARPNHWYSGVYTTSASGISRRSYGIAATNSRLQIWQIAGVSGWNPGLQWTRYPRYRSDFWFFFDNSNHRWRFLGIAYYAYSPSAGTTSSIFTVHLAWIAAMAAALPAAWCIQKFKAAPPGTCPFCRYNLTGNTSGVCPECGTPVAGKAR